MGLRERVKKAADSIPLLGRGRDKYADGHTPSEALSHEMRRRRRDARYVHKQDADADSIGDEPDRKNSLPPELARQVSENNGVRKPYDFAYLKDLAANSAVQAYIDTLAQDAASASWHLEPRDDAEVDDDERREAERTLEEMHPEMTFRDIREATAKNFLTLGDGAWLKHYTPSGDFAEVVPLDTSRVFKVINDHGLTEGYLQASFQQRSIAQEFDLEEVVWFEWSSRPDHIYGEGPVEKAQGIIELLDELQEKERKDLKEGMPSGIVSVSAGEEGFKPMVEDAYDKVNDNWQLSEGERHRAIVSKADWDFTPLQPGYSDLQFLPRTKFWIHSLGAVFKVNAPYAGFDFQEGNRAQNEAQTQAYKQRGFRVLLRQMQESINRQLVWPDLNDDLQFRFETEQSTEEQKNEADRVRAQAEAAEKVDQIGLNVRWEDGELRVEDGDVDAPDPGADGEGLPEPENAPDGDTPDVTVEEHIDLSKEEVRDLDQRLLDVYKSQIWPESIDDVTKEVWSGDDAVPQYVLEEIQNAIEDGAVFSDIEAIGAGAQEALEDLLTENMTQPQGWSTRSIVDDMKEVWPGVSEEKLAVVARTETASVLNKAREKGYMEQEDVDARFYWQGPDDSRTTDACEELKARTNPDYGGTPVPMPELKRMEQEVHDKHFSDLQFRDHTIHPHERHTFVKHIE